MQILYNIFLKSISLFRSSSQTTNLHRWCHSLLPNCNNDVILRKIDLANYDNSCDFSKK